MKVGAFIPIRLDSERLPGKALMKAAGKPMVHHLLDRVFASRNIISREDVVVCTTSDNVDDALAHAVKSYGGSIFRGDKNDLIRRFKDAADHFGFEIILQVDGDDPLADTQYMDLTIEALMDDDSLDAATTVGLPFGINVKSFTRNALNKVFQFYRSKQNDTGFALYFTKSSICQCREIAPLSNAHIMPDARLTLDYIEDLEMFRRVLDSLYKPGELFDLTKLVTFLNSHPEIVAINSGLQEAYAERSREKFSLQYANEAGVVQKIEL